MKKSYVLRFPSSAEILNQQVMLSYLNGGVDVNLRVGSESGPFPLAVAAGALNFDVCKTLLEAGARVDGWKKGFGTPMAYAVRALGVGDNRTKPARYAILVKLCELLLNYGANPYEEDPHSALDLAAALGFREVVELLTTRGDLKNIGPHGYYSYTAAGELVAGPDADINQAMQYAHHFKNEDVMVRLLAMGAKESRFREDGLTPFQAFVVQELDKVVAYYVRERGEDLAQKTETGKTLLQIAKSLTTKNLLRSLKAGVAVQELVTPVAVGIKDIDVIHDGMVANKKYEVFAI